MGNSSKGMVYFSRQLRYPPPMRFGRPYTLIIVLTLAAVNTPLAQANLGFCATLLEAAREAYTEASYGSSGLIIHRTLEADGMDRFHPRAKVRRSFFQLLLAGVRATQKRTAGLEPKIQELVRALRRYSPEEIELIARQAVLKAKGGAQFKLPSKPQRWARSLLLNQEPSPALDAIDAKYTWLDGWRVERAALEHAERMRTQLTKAGLHTRPLPHTNEAGRRLVVLQITDLTAPGLAQNAQVPLEKVLFEPFFEAPQALQYLRVAQKQDGVIAIDPGMGLDHATTLAYFHDFDHPSQNPIPARWMIGLRVDSPFLDLEHEWQHKLDAFDRKDQFESQLLLARMPHRNWETLGALDRLGHVVEDSHWCEVVATRHELSLMQGQCESSHIEYQRAQNYFQSSLRMAALARILQEPLNREHYRLWLDSWKKP